MALDVAWLARLVAAMCFGSVVTGTAAGTASESQSADARQAMIATLAAPGPHSSLGSEALVFDRFVGTWDCDYSFYAEDGSVRHATGELRFGWIIDGRAVQDVWIGYAAKPNEERTIGTSVRFLDRTTGLWRVVFVAPAFNGLITMQGGVEGDRIVLRGADSDGGQIRWTFNEIKANSFTWRGEKSLDGGKNWRLEEQHHMTRRAPRAA